MPAGVNIRREEQGGKTKLSEQRKYTVKRAVGQSIVLSHLNICDAEKFLSVSLLKSKRMYENVEYALMLLFGV